MSFVKTPLGFHSKMSGVWAVIEPVKNYLKFPKVTAYQKGDLKRTVMYKIVSGFSMGTVNPGGMPF